MTGDEKTMFQSMRIFHSLNDQPPDSASGLIFSNTLSHFLGSLPSSLLLSFTLTRNVLLINIIQLALLPFRSSLKLTFLDFASLSTLQKISASLPVDIFCLPCIFPPLHILLNKQILFIYLFLSLPCKFNEGRYFCVFVYYWSQFKNHCSTNVHCANK